MTKKPNLLLIEDNFETAEVMAEILRQSDIDVVVVADGTEGLVALECQTFDGILVDYRMPKMDGLEMVKQAKEKGLLNGAQVIYMSADSRMMINHTAGIYKLYKPFSIDALMDVLLLAGLVKTNMWAEGCPAYR